MSEKASGDLRVVLVGRPNVGKSTLFNRVAGSRRAIVAPVAGTTRDVMRHSVEWLGTEFELVDIGGVFGASTDPLQAAVAERGLRELQSAAVIVVLVDAREGLVPADEDVVRQVRRTGVPLVLAINKVDDPRAATAASEFERLAVSPALSVAAEHGLGIGDLLDVVVGCLPGRSRRRAESGSAVSGRGQDDREVSIAIVGRPNVGKSSLVNQLVREDRVLVSDLAGTTRDAVDTLVGWHGRRIRLVDTAGIRRPGRVAQSGGVEAVSVVLARRTLARADVAVLLVDAVQGVTRQDAVIAGEAERAGCGVIIAANKWDLVKDRGPGFSKAFDADVRRGLRFAEFAPILHVSALTGQRAPRVVERAVDVATARATHVGTAELNRVVARITARHRPASPGRHAVKILYATQIGARPPSFVFFTNIATRFHFSYERYLRNQLRDAFGFEGSPIRIKARPRRDQPRRGRRG
ncbi:MAG: ribosome biogenesis GTPase Der [Acidobacteria bacterium]|nr:ribosome biogenesis GTPase Der [Acidobacteriota bacterium]